MAVGELYRYRHWQSPELPLAYRQAMAVQISAVGFKWFDHNVMSSDFVYTLGTSEDPSDFFERIELCQ